MSCKALIAYLPSVLFVLPWMAVALISKQDEISNFWGSIPEWKNMFWTILFWLSGRRVLWYICLLTGLIGCVVAAVKMFRKEKLHDHCALVVGCGLEGLILFFDSVALKGYIKSDKICKMTQIGGRITVAIVLIFSLELCYREEYKAIREPFEEFREAADELTRDERVWQKNTLFIGSNRYCALDGFIEYYFDQRGYQSPANVMDGG